MPLTLKKGSKGKDVFTLQSLLVDKGYGPMAKDGQFGSVTDKLVKQFQADAGLKADGIVGDKTWNALYAAPKAPKGKKKPTHSGRYTTRVQKAWEKYGDIVGAEAVKLGVEPATLIAVIAVESGGDGVKDGKPLIRFENHLFGRWIDKDRFDQHFKHAKKEPWKGHQMKLGGKWVNVHTGSQETEYEALDLALSIIDLDTEADIPYRCASYGAPQILGSWYKRLGYNSAVAMYDSFHYESKQIYALFRFLRTGSGANKNPDAGMHLDLVVKDWLTFAGKYNGPGQAKWYEGELKDAYKAAVAEQD